FESRGRNVARASKADAGARVVPKLDPECRWFRVWNVQSFQGCWRSPPTKTSRAGGVGVLTVMGRISTSAGERLLVDDGKSMSVVVREGVASVRATAHLVRIDFYDDSAPNVGNEQAVALALRIAMPVDAFLRFADEIRSHATNIESLLQRGDSHDVPQNG